MFEISLNDFLNIRNPQIIDIRDSYSYNLGHIKGAKNVMYNDIDYYYDKYLSRYETYYIYCDMGKKSARLSYKLNNLGYRVYSIKGGYEGYKNRIY